MLDPETLSLAENVDRLAGDADLVTALELGGYTGHDWNVFSNELAKYGIGVITGWMYRGLILTRCKEWGYGGLAPQGRPGHGLGPECRRHPDERRERVMLRCYWIGSRRPGGCGS